MTSERAIYRKALIATAVTMVALAGAAAIGGWLVAQSPGMVAALIGVGVAAVAGMSTQITMVVGHRFAPHAMAAILLGTWLLKMVIIVVALLILQGVDDFHRGVFVTVVMVGIIATLVIDIWVIQRGRLAYVEPSSKK